MSIPCSCGGVTRVVETRRSPCGVRRRRECRACLRRFTTFELTDERLQELRRRAALWDEVVRRSNDAARAAG